MSQTNNSNMNFSPNTNNNNTNTNNNKSNIQKLCAPAVIYLIFSLVQIIIDLFKGLYNQSFFKFIVMIIFTLLLNALCAGGLGIISWLIVFVPFMLMSLITAILLFVFGLDPSTGKMTYDSSSDNSNTTQTKYVFIDPREQQINENEDYDPDDYYSGTPADINHYNNTIDNSNSKVGTDCASKNMKTCGSTGPNVCYEMDDDCPGVGSDNSNSLEAPMSSQTSNVKSSSNKSIPGKYDKLNPNESSGAANVDSDSKFYGSNNPSDPNAPIPKLPDGPFNPNALELTRPQNNYTARDMIKNKSISKAPPPPGTTSVEQFIENMNLSFRF